MATCQPIAPPGHTVETGAPTGRKKFQVTPPSMLLITPSSVAPK